MGLASLCNSWVMLSDRRKHCSSCSSHCSSRCCFSKHSEPIPCTADGCKRGYKTSERTQNTRETAVITVRRLLRDPEVYSLAGAPMNGTSWYQINQRMYLKGHQPIGLFVSFLDLLQYQGLLIRYSTRHVLQHRLVLFRQ